MSRTRMHVWTIFRGLAMGGETMRLAAPPRSRPDSAGRWPRGYEAPAEAAECDDGVVATTLTRAVEFGCPPGTPSVGVHFKPWVPAPFLRPSCATGNRRMRTP